MIEWLNANSGAVNAVATFVLVIVTIWYAYTTQSLLIEAKKSRLQASEPRVVAYLRLHEVLSNVVQLCVVNLSGAPAFDVTAQIEKITEWPNNFDLKDSKILRDITFLSPQEVLRLDLGIGPELFRNGNPAEFTIKIQFSSADNRLYNFSSILRVESVLGPRLKTYGIDDVFRVLKDISATLNSFKGERGIRVETYSAEDRQLERQEFERWRNEVINGESENI